jgi:hypothetical protein
MNDDNGIPLVKGGQGRSDEEVAESACIAGWCFLGSLVILAIVIIGALL